MGPDPSRLDDRLADTVEQKRLRNPVGEPVMDLSGSGEMSLGLSSAGSGPVSPFPSGQLSQYRIVGMIGRGGMGAVYQAEDTALGRKVALKIILPDHAARPTARERFLREARAAAALSNDHVVTIYQVGEDRGIPFLAMEFLQGETLESRMGRGGLTIAEVVRIGREMCSGLGAAHAIGLIHRDVKPANVWLESPHGRVKLLDFGLAREAGSQTDLTSPGGVIGTPEYMSPEQARGEELDVRSDLFSLGIVLYALCTGRTPFRGNSVMAILTALAVETPPSIRQMNPKVPPQLADVIERLLAKDREKRPASADEVARLLAAVEVTDDSITPPAPPGGSMMVSAVAEGPRPRRVRLLAGLGGVAVLGILAAVAWAIYDRGAEMTPGPSGEPIRIGILHSRTGTMAIGERAVGEAALMAVEEINAAGGLLGRPVEAVVVDGESDELVFARRAEELISDHGVRAIFGCWTSASRKAVLPVLEKHDHLLVYPVQYEGAEQSPQVIYLGPVPNQQILPALRFVVGFQGKRRWFLVGSDYVFPRTANAVIRDEAQTHGATIVGEEYLKLGVTDDVGRVVRAIEQARPDLIVNTINGDINVAFFRSLRGASPEVARTPVLSFSLAASELIAIGPRHSAGDFVGACYFESLDTPANVEFLRRFAAHYGRDRPVSPAVQAAYAGVYLWAQAVRAAGSDEPRLVRAAMHGQSIDAPQGTLRIDPATQHAVQTARVGRVGEDGRVVEVYVSPRPVEPDPFPGPRSREEWSAFLNELYRKWGGRWSAQGP